MAFERIHPRRPELAELIQPRIQFPERLWFQPIKAPLCIHGGLDQARVAQDAQVLGHGRLGHAELPLDAANRLLACHQKAQYRAAVGLRDD